MKARQRGALEHPVRFTLTPEAPHKNRVERIRNRCTILTVTEVIRGVWVWHASMSYQDTQMPGALPLARWTEAQTRKGDRELRSLLDGVGGDFVFGVKPAEYDLASWAEMGLTGLDVITDPDAVAYASDLIAQSLPASPSQFSAMHLWRELTQDELRHVLN